MKFRRRPLPNWGCERHNKNEQGQDGGVAANRRYMNKDRELYYLDRVRALYSDLPSSIPCVSESPDFVFDNGKLGVEIVDYIRALSGPSITLRTIESLRAKVALDAQKKFFFKHSIPLWVGVHWNDRYKFTNRDVDLLGSRLAELIEQDIPNEPYQGTVFDITGRWENESVFEMVSRVAVTRLKPESKGLWPSIEVGFIGIGIDEVAEFVKTKETKLGRYLANCDEVWLLIIADGRHISSSVELKADNSLALCSSFTRVLLYDAIVNAVTRLR